MTMSVNVLIKTGISHPAISAQAFPEHLTNTVTKSNSAMKVEQPALISMRKNG